jgi:hypothetical protein
LLEFAHQFNKLFLMDCTYKTNRYGMPLFHIVRVEVIALGQLGSPKFFASGSARGGSSPRRLASLTRKLSSPCGGGNVLPHSYEYKEHVLFRCLVEETYYSITKRLYISLCSIYNYIFQQFDYHGKLRLRCLT